jgi:signal transduction histidine kinase
LKGTVYSDNYQSSKALEATLLSYQYYKQVNDTPATVVALKNSAGIYRTLAAFDKAIEYQLQALSLSLTTGDERKIAINYNNTGILYKDLQDYDNAIIMHGKSLALKESIGYLRGQVYSHNNIGEAYRLAGKTNKSLMHLTSAKSIAKKINNKKLMFYAFLYLGRLHRDIGQYEQASTYLTEARDYFEETKRISRLAETYLALGRLLLVQGELKLALEMIQKSMHFANESHKTIVIFESYQELSVIYEKLGNFESALQNEKAFQQQKEEIFNEQRQRFIHTLKVEYDVEQKQLEINELLQKNKITALQVDQQIYERNIAITSSLLFFSLISFFYYRYNQRKKLNDKQIALMQIKAKEQDLIELNANLENIVAQRTESLTSSNSALEATLLELKNTQESLVEVEKMASLSRLVAGVAHEVNTPLGTVITAVSYLQDELASFKSKVSENKLSRSRLDQFLASITHSSELIEQNTSRSAELIHEFKQVAIQERLDPPQTFLLSDCIDKVMSSLIQKPVFNNVTYRLVSKGDNHITSYSTYWFQILESLLSNTTIHGFPHAQSQSQSQSQSIQVVITIELLAKHIKVTFSDNGCGVNPEKIKSIFEPFYTTLRSRGHVGLGLHIIYNMINQTLKGSMYYEQEEVGACFVIELPIKL